jgi:hypothetical protein
VNLVAGATPVKTFPPAAAPKRRGRRRRRRFSRALGVCALVAVVVTVLVR